MGLIFVRCAGGRKAILDLSSYGVPVYLNPEYVKYAKEKAEWSGSAIITEKESGALGQNKGQVINFPSISPYEYIVINSFQMLMKSRETSFFLEFVSAFGSSGSNVFYESRDEKHFIFKGFKCTGYKKEAGK